jgi:hypothetical protein
MDENPPTEPHDWKVASVCELVGLVAANPHKMGSRFDGAEQGCFRRDDMRRGWRGQSIDSCGKWSGSGPLRNGSGLDRVSEVGL